MKKKSQKGKLYQSPNLIEYGSLSDLVRNMATGSFTDNSGAKMTGGMREMTNMMGG